MVLHFQTDTCENEETAVEGVFFNSADLQLRFLFQLKVQVYSYIVDKMSQDNHCEDVSRAF